MELHQKRTELEAKRDLIARLDRAVELAQDLERQVDVAAGIVEDYNAMPLAA